MAYADFKNPHALKLNIHAGKGNINPVFQDTPMDEAVCYSEEDEDVNGEDSGEEDFIDRTIEHRTPRVLEHDVSTEVRKRKQTKRSKSKYKWDVFKTTSKDNVAPNEDEFWQTVFKVTKVLFCIFLFCCVLCSLVLSKSTLFILISNIFPPNSVRNTTMKTSNYHFKYYTSETAITNIWALVLIVITPYVFNVAISLWKLMFKKMKPIELRPLCFTLLAETLHSVGLSIFIFVLLPNMDPVSGLLFCMSVAIIPSLLKTLYLEANTTSGNKFVRRLLSLCALITSVSSIALWTFFVYRMDKDLLEKNPSLILLTVLSPILVSVVWWENFVPMGKDNKATGLRLMKMQIFRRRTKIVAIVSLWKTILTVCLVSVIFGIDCADGVTCIQTLYNVITKLSISSYVQTDNATVNGTITTVYNQTFATDNSSYLLSAILGHTKLVTEIYIGTCSKYLPLYIAVVNIAASLFCYRCCVTANKILAQIPGFSLPLVLSTPITAACMIAGYAHTELRMTDGCFLPFPQWTGGLDFDWTMIIASILGYISVLTVTNYIWRQTKERMQPGKKMFIRQLYCGIFLDQSLLLNKRMDEEIRIHHDEKEKFVELPIPKNLGEWRPEQDEWSPLRKDDTPFIYLCATMWHETIQEMTQILKSIFRIDKDQCARRNLQLFFAIKDPDYYEFEAHILFDDAFTYSGDSVEVNSYVKDLMKSIDQAMSSIHGQKMKNSPPTKIETPYGGRLVWRLPGGNKLIAHLKDKAKIRNRKRWSQVMYLYYFLAHKLLSLGGAKDRLETIAKNTFILALDGDVDFQPSALKLLVDRMKLNPSVGAACGRIHPIGNGPMVWYQKFEYAVSHWLQKATEHTIGCVLCSPGCFSLFRGSSLMDDDVMNRYTTPPTEPRHYVQYDQGEDRWLCTLLLQQGYRVEYCAASDALTYAPEGFNEFYNQRRRWTPSTMANILDLLLDYKKVTMKNNDISMLYIAYQMFLMVSSILTPGTIFLMIIGAVNMAYPTIALKWILVVNLIPVGIFILLCFVAKSNVQLAFAAILSTIYSLAMMLVIVGLIKQIADNGICSVTTIFLCFVAGVFVVAAFVHPQEFWCIIHGFLYFLAIPSMSMLLMLYSIGNLNIVSWGTRETPKPMADQHQSSANKMQPEKKGAIGDLLEKVGLSDKFGKSDYMFSFGNLFRCICCPSDTQPKDEIQLMTILERLDEMESRMPTTPKEEDDTGGISERHVNFSDNTEKSDMKEESVKLLSDRQHKHWTHDAKLMDGATEYLSKEEKDFWEQLIEKYLFPLEGDKKAQDDIQKKLNELRNTVCLFFLLVNALFVTIVFSLQQVNADSGGTISQKLPCSTGHAGGSFEPISMAFTAIFGILLFIQFVCMISHRLTTFLQICSITEITFRRKHVMFEGEKLSVKKSLELCQQMQEQREEDTKSVISEDLTLSGQSSATSLNEVTTPIDGPKKSQLWSKLSRRSREQQINGTLNQTFIKNFTKFQHFVEEEQDQTKQKGETKVSHTKSETDELKDLRRTFRGFDKSNIRTLALMSHNPRYQESILSRGHEVVNQWKRVTAKARLQNTTKLSTLKEMDKIEEEEEPSTRSARKVTIHLENEEERIKTDNDEVDEDMTEKL
ncbi:chitin synthase chs-2-like [Mercenaria mercenaria]|uniref:chitin synthase chs-2-like n=1 Tax=Mercenaria mercenaria TaxID=6596 RepID=UPI00234EF701|nr:chitin synthase chs-2-like [Mercenaria mercenaria]